MPQGAGLLDRAPNGAQDRPSCQGPAAIRLLLAVALGACVLALPLVISLGAVRFAFSWQPIYTYAVTAYRADETTGIPAPELLRATRTIRSYFTNRQHDLDVTVTDASGASGPLFNEREIAHMRDVKSLVRRLYLVLDLAAAALLSCVMAMVWLRPGAGLRLARAAIAGSLATVVMLVLLGAVAAAGFDRLFLEFHLLSFSNDYWELDPARDHLVQIFPQGFWFDATLFVALAALLSAALVAVLSLSYLFLLRPPKA